MNTKQQKDDFPEIQAAIYGMALSLDAFLLNGIPYGVLQEEFFRGFLETTAGNLLTELAHLESQASQASISSQPKATEAMAALRARCQQLIELVTGLTSFRTLSLEQLRATVSQVPLLRKGCVQLLQLLESCFQVPKPFYPSRPAHSTAAINDFLADLERVFTRAWHDSSLHRSSGRAS